VRPAPIKSELLKDPQLAAKQLESYFLQQRHIIVAYSGGVDSALLAYVAHLVLKNKMVAVLADSPSLSRKEHRFAVKFVQDHAIPLEIVRTQEMDNPLYQANQGNRCYFCKKALFERIEELSRQIKSSGSAADWPVCYGVNVDDLGDYRPGIQAANEAMILSPYVELGFDKKTIRAVSAYHNLEIAEKPATPCLASRIAYGEEVTPQKLNQVEKAEDVLYDLGLKVLRVRHHGNIARIEIPSRDFEIILKNKEKISRRFHKLGFTYISLDLDGFKSGSLNAALN
jgi:uncharacterized protein